MELTLNIWSFIIGIIGTVLGLIGVVLTIRSNRKKELVYSIKSNNLISGSISDLENLKISYKDRKIDNLTVSKILFYDRGNETIRLQDLMTKDHFSIASSTSDILDARLVKVNYVPNNVRLQHKNNSRDVYIDFDYLDNKQGAIVQVIHTGISSNELMVLGSVIGAKKLLQIRHEQLINPVMDKKSLRVFLLTLLFGIVGMFFAPYFYAMGNSNNLIASITGFILFVVVFISWFLLILFMIGFLRIIVYSNRVVPEGLEEFKE